MSDTENVVADAKKFVNWLHEDGEYPHTVVAMRKVFDYVERLEARGVIADELITDLETPLHNIPLGPDEALVARVEAYLNRQTGDTP